MREYREIVGDSGEVVRVPVGLNELYSRVRIIGEKRKQAGEDVKALVLRTKQTEQAVCPDAVLDAMVREALELWLQLGDELSKAYADLSAELERKPTKTAPDTSPAH